MPIKNIRVKEAAERMGVSQQFIRIGLQRKLLPIGVAIKLSSKWTYHISPKQLAEYIGENEGVNKNGRYDNSICK